MGVVLHIHALEHEGYTVLFRVHLDAAEGVVAELILQVAHEPLSKIAVGRRLGGDKQGIIFLIPGNKTEEAILLHIGGDGEGELMLEHVQLCLRALIDIEELLISTGNNLLFGDIDVEATGFCGLLVPDFVVKRLFGEVEGGNIAILLLADEAVLAKLNNDIADGLLALLDGLCR